MAARRWKWSSDSPDVVTCDLIMPGIDGVDFIRTQMASRPVPIVVVSIAAESSERVLRALDAGAVDFVQKPTALATEKMFEIADDLVAKVKAAAESRLARPVRRARLPRRGRPRRFIDRFDLVVIGVSTGGPQGLKVGDSAASCRFSGADRDCAAHADRLYGDLRQALDDASALTVVEAHEAIVRPGSCSWRRPAVI